MRDPANDSAADDWAVDEPTGKLKALSRQLGFLRLGVAAAQRSPNADAFLRWLDRGQHADMSYMARHVARRIDPRESLPGAQRVVVVTLPYHSGPEFPPADDPSRGKIARYARGRDYHKVMPPRLRELAEWIADGGRYRCWFSVDTGPILERDWAQAAGVGWIGKNGLVIDPSYGSWCFLGVIVTDRALAVDPPATDHCGSCRACLDACPTQAFPEPRTVDANRCISYWTIEHRGEFATPAPHLHGWIFGCDVCQEVCPFNTRRQRPQPDIVDDFAPRPLPDRLSQWLALDREQFLELCAGTPLTRPGLPGMVRNARETLQDVK